MATPVTWTAGWLLPPGTVVEPLSQVLYSYVATQAAPATTGTTEPVWPTTVGGTVADGGVTWTCQAATTITWTCTSPYVSSGSEPTWPTTPGGTVSDGTITWKCATQTIPDANCPNSKILAIGASKVFAGDKDIVRFCATVNPLDWTSANDAGFIGTGLQGQQGSNEVSVLNLYRSNLAMFNSTGFQMWQIDPDPALIDLLDAMDGIGSTYQFAATPVANDLFYLTKQGIRTVGISARSNNLVAGDVGMPIDSLIQAALAVYPNPPAIYYPGQGQYWIAFGPQVFVYSIHQVGQVGAWSRYVYPWNIDRFAVFGDDLYMRHGDIVSKVDTTLNTDDVAGTPTPFDGLVQWPWLDGGSPGIIKMLESFDVVGSGTLAFSIGYDQTDPTAFTTPFAIDADTMIGVNVPMPVSAPSMSIKITATGGSAWSLNEVNLYAADFPKVEE